MRKFVLAITAATMAATTAVPAEARHHHRQHQRQYYQTDNGIQYWRGRDGRNYCKRSNGTTGLIVGAAAGALAGRAIDTRGERTTGTVLGAAAGALLGREVTRSHARCR